MLYNDLKDLNKGCFNPFQPIKKAKKKGQKSNSANRSESIDP